MLDVAHQFPAQVGDRGEDAPRRDVALDLREPEFDLIEPRRIRRRVMEMDGRMCHQEGPDLLRFVGREIVHDDVHLASSGLCLDDGLQEADKFRARVPRRGVAHHFARSGVERGIQRERPVSVVLEAVPFGAPWRQRQDRVEPIERLNRRLFVDAEHHGVLGRIEVQADNIRGLRLELGIGRPHVPFEPMRLQPGMSPRSGDNRVLHAQLAPERPRRPMRRAVRRRAARPRHDARFQGRRQHGRLRAAMASGQSGGAVRHEALLPQRDRPRTAPGPLGDRGVAAAVGEQQKDPCASRRVGSPTPRSHTRFEVEALFRRQHERCRREWHAPSYDLQVVSTSH